MANLDHHFQAIVEESGPDSLMELWNYLGSVYTANSINQALSELKEHASRENALWGDADTLPDDEMEIIDSDLSHPQRVETMAVLRASKKAKARASGLRVVPVPVPIPVR